MRYFITGAATALLAPALLATPIPLPDSMSPVAKTTMEAMAKAFSGPTPAPPKTLAEWDARNAQLEAFVQRFDAPVLAALQPRLSELTIGGVPVIKVEPKSGARATPILIYVHGGGFTLFSAKSTVAGAATMAERAGLAVYSVDYTRAPRASWGMITDQVIAVYRALLTEGHKAGQIGMFGDSAGGNLVAASVLKLRDQGLPLPAALVLLSPVTDLTGAGDTRITLSDADPILRPGDREAGLEAYAPPGDRRNPYVSPVYGDYRKGYPPTLIQAGTREWLLSDSVREYQAIAGGGNVAVLDIYEGMPHVFQNVLHGTPESERAYDRAAAFWKQYLPR